MTNLRLATALVYAVTVLALPAPVANADNSRLNKSVVVDNQLQLAAQWHAVDVLNNRALDGDIGSDGSTPQTRSAAAGFGGSNVAETVAINPALAISGIELINQWFANPDYLAIMRDCRYSLMGVWSENSLDRTVVVAVYGQPA